MTGNYCLWFVTVLRHGDDRYDEDEDDDDDYDNDDIDDGCDFGRSMLVDGGDYWLNAGGQVSMFHSHLSNSTSSARFWNLVMMRKMMTMWHRLYIFKFF